MWCCVWLPDFLKKMFYPQNGKNWPGPGFLECIGKFRVFFSVFYFFISLVYNKSLYYCNFCMLEQISYLGKFWFLRYGPKCSWPIRLWYFSINRRNLKLAVSNKEISEINWFLVCLSNSFLRNGSLGFSSLGNSNIAKLTEPFFPGKFIFDSNFGKRAQNATKIGFLGIFKKNLWC